MPYRIPKSIGQFSCYHDPCLVFDDFFCPNELAIRPGSYAGHQKSKGREGRAFIRSMTSSLVILARISLNARFALRYGMALWCSVGYCAGHMFGQASWIDVHEYDATFFLAQPHRWRTTARCQLSFFSSTSKPCFVLNYSTVISGIQYDILIDIFKYMVSTLNFTMHAEGPTCANTPFPFEKSLAAPALAKSSKQITRTYADSVLAALHHVSPTPWVLWWASVFWAEYWQSNLQSAASLHGSQICLKPNVHLEYHDKKCSVKMIKHIQCC